MCRIALPLAFIAFALGACAPPAAQVTGNPDARSGIALPLTYVHNDPYSLVMPRP